MPLQPGSVLRVTTARQTANDDQRDLLNHETPCVHIDDSRTFGDGGRVGLPIFGNAGLLFLLVTARRAMRFSIVITLLCALALLAGCVSDKEVNAQGRLPWNAPAAWEGQTLGVPF